MIICIEGADATGKATQSKILAESLGARHFSFPDYETPAGREILRNLKSDRAVKLAGNDRIANALVLQSLMLTNRMERGADLRAAMRAGHVVLDRYDASALVYGTLDGLDPMWLRETNQQLPVRPDLYLLLDAPVEEGFKRRPERRDRYEADRAFLEKVREGYLRLFAEQQEARVRQIVEAHAARNRPAFDKNGTRQSPLYLPVEVPWITIDGTGSVEEVAARVAAAAGLTSLSTTPLEGDSYAEIHTRWRAMSRQEQNIFQAANPKLFQGFCCISCGSPNARGVSGCPGCGPEDRG